MPAAAESSRQELEKEHCGVESDAASGQPEVTRFKRAARLHQARWRQEHGLLMGGRTSRAGAWTPVGSRLNLDEARRSGANFLTELSKRAVEHRLGNPEPYQMLDEVRLRSDLLSSMPMCFNLFGALWGDLSRAETAVRSWFPDAPGRVNEVRFEWSPGRRDPEYLGNQSALDAALLLKLPDGARGVVGVETKYHEHAQPAPPPRKDQLARYREVAARSGVFVPGFEAQVVGTDLQQLWLDHLLVLSMLQHHSRTWRWGRFVLVHPQGNPSFADAGWRYRLLLTDSATFEVRTLEDLLGADEALPDELIPLFRERYLMGNPAFRVR